MAAAASGFSPAFVKWQLPPEYDAPVGRARRQQLREDFRRSVELPTSPQDASKRQPSQVQQAEWISQPPSQVQPKGKPPNSAVKAMAPENAGTSALKVALATHQLPECPAVSKDIRSHLQSQAEQLLIDATPAERSIIQRALKLAVDHPKACGGCSGGRRGAQQGQINAVAAAANQNASPHSPQRGMAAFNPMPVHRTLPREPPQQQQQQQQWAAAGNASHKRPARENAAIGHYRIHPEWGWDEQPAAYQESH